jgi:hypothetical protein
VAETERLVTHPQGISPVPDWIGTNTPVRDDAAWTPLPALEGNPSADVCVVELKAEFRGGWR